MSDDTDQPASRIIDAFGGIRPMAAQLDIPVSTVQGWKQRDTIPAARMDTVRAAAAAAGIDLESGGASDKEASEPSKPETSGGPQDRHETPHEARGSGAEIQSAAPSRASNVAVFALLVSLAVGGWVAWTTVGPGAAGGDNARLSALEGRIARLADAAGTNAAGADQAALAELTKDVTALRARLSDLPAPDLAGSLAPLRAEIDSLRDALAARGSQPGGGESPDPSLLARLDALEAEVQNAVQIASTNMQAMSGALLEFDARLKAFAEAQAELRSGLETRIAGLEAGRTADEIAVSRASALALAAGQLRTALERGVPFTGTLAIAESLDADDATVAAAFEMLRKSAGSGVATGSALELSFANLVPELLAAGRRGQNGDFVDRLTDRVNDIVSIRRTGADVQGNDIQARIARAEVLLANRDVAAAVAEFTDVGGAPGEILSPWVSRARGYLDSHDALAVIEAQAIARLRAEGGS